MFERNLSNVEEIGTCSYINHIITMTTLYIQQVGLLPFILLLSSWYLFGLSEFPILITSIVETCVCLMRVVKFGCLCSISWRARPKRRRWQTRARLRSLSVTRWPSARASTTRTATGDTEPAGNRNLQPVYYYITAVWFLLNHLWLQEVCIHMKSSVHLPCLSNVGWTGQTGLLSI